MKIEIPKGKYSNLTSKEQQALHNLKIDKNIVIKGADEGSAVVIWNREDSIKEAVKQLEGSDEILSVPDDYCRPLISTFNNKTCCSLQVRLLYLSFGISIFINLKLICMYKLIWC